MNVKQSHDKDTQITLQQIAMLTLVMTEKNKRVIASKREVINLPFPSLRGKRINFSFFVQCGIKKEAKKLASFSP